MPIAIRSADLAQDRLLLIELLRQHLTPLSDQRRFDWLYCRGPAGPAQAWLAWDEKEGKLVGAGAAFPRQVRIGSETLLCQVLGDFCIAPAYRSLGPSLQLQRACLSAALSGEIPFCYDFPSRSMMAIYKRLGVTALGQVVRFVKPLKVNRKVEDLVGKGTLAKGVSAIGNRLLTLKDWRHRTKYCEISLHSGPFGEEFTELDSQLAPRYPLCLSRTAHYLNWRYHTNPLLQCQVLAARRAGELLAFATLAVEQQDALLVDVFADSSAPEVHELLAGVVELGRQAHVQAINAPALKGSVLASVLERAGFFAREGTPMIVCTKTDSRFAGFAANPANWWVTHGDRDV
jgi:hypothetical protein